MLDKVILKGPEVKMSDAEFFRFCQDNRDLNIERNAQREIIIMSPTYAKTGLINLRIATQLDVWNETARLGVAFDSSAGFTLPDGSVRSPDVSWMTQDKWNALTEAEQESFAPVCPDFVLELKSKTDRLTDLQDKMNSYLTNGVKLGWLIDWEASTVYIYERGAELRTHTDLSVPLSADPVLPGFQLDFDRLPR